MLAATKEQGGVRCGRSGVGPAVRFEIAIDDAVLADPHQMPCRFVARYFNLTRWTVADRGGHFAPMEQPEILIEDIPAFYRPCRAHRCPAGWNTRVKSGEMNA